MTIHFDEIESRLSGRPLVLMLDIDGTLCELMPTPDEARIPDHMRDILRQLADTPDVHVAFVTGRGVADALQMVGIDGVYVYGNHGIEVASPSGAITVDAVAHDAELALRTAAGVLERVVHDTPGALLEDKRYTLSLHYRTAPIETIGRLRATVQDVGARYGLRVTEGSCVIELRPPRAPDKGHAVLRLASELGADTADASLLFAGDDVTDEDAFRALRDQLPRAVTVNVGDRVAETAAQYRIDGPDMMRQLLERILLSRLPRETGVPV